MFEYLKSFQTLRNTTLSSLRKPWCSQTLSFIRCGSGLPEIPLAMHPGLSRTSIRTLILTGLWLGRSVSSLKILESLGKFIPERDNLQYSSFQLKKKKKLNRVQVFGKNNERDTPAWNDYCTWKLPEQRKQKAASIWNLLPNTGSNPRVSGPQLLLQAHFFPLPDGKFCNK